MKSEYRQALGDAFENQKHGGIPPSQGCVRPSTAVLGIFLGVIFWAIVSFSTFLEVKMEMSGLLSIRKAVEKAKEDGFSITEYTLRRWVQSGEIPYRTPGKKILIYYPLLIAYLKCEKPPGPTDPANIFKNGA